MNNLKNTTSGVDTPIQLFQKFLYDALKSKWQLDDTTLAGYGRVYKNANDKGYVPELFVASADANNTVYTPVMFDKANMRAMFFFTDADRSEYKLGNEIKIVSLICICNLALIKPNVQHRADEEVKKEVADMILFGPGGHQYLGTDTGFKNVFKEFTGLINKDGEVFEDRHPLFCFRHNMKMMYQPASC